MGKPLRVLIIEDSDADAILLDRHLAAAGYDVTSHRVDTKAAMKAGLEEEGWQVVLCDYTMPDFDAIRAHEVLRESGRDLPFIIISGTVGEEKAVQALLNGAHDYIPKNNLSRLIPAIERELKEAENRSERRAAEEALRLSEGRHRELFEFAPDGIIIASPESYYLDANPGMCQMLGYEHSQLIGMHASDIVDPSETKDLNAALAEVPRAGRYSEEWCFSRKDGSTFIGEVIARIMPDGNLLAMVRDVTERHEAEEKIKFSESQLNQAQRLTNIGSWSWDLKDNTLFWSDEHYRIYGLQPGEVAPSYDIVLESAVNGGRDVLTSAVDRSLETLEPFEVYFSIIRPDGALRILASRGSVDADANGHPIRMYGTVQDVTEIKRAENERRVISEVVQGVATTPSLDEYLKLVHRSISQIVYAENCAVMLYDRASSMEHFEFWTDKYDPPPPPHLAGKGFGNYVRVSGKALLLTEEAQREIIEAGDAEEVGTQAPSWLGVPLRTPQGTIGVLVLQHYEKKDAYSESDLEFISSVGDQIALAVERKRAEEALGSSEQRYRTVVETALDVIITIDEMSSIVFVNPAAERVFGYRVDEMMGRSLTMLMPESLAPRHMAGVERYQKTGVKHVPWDEVEVTCIHKDGHEVPITFSFADFVQDGQRLFTGIIRDVTDRKRALDALRESEERYRDLFENAIDIIYTQDLEGNYTSINKAGERITGFTREESLNRNARQVIAPEYHAKVNEMIAAKMEGSERTAYELEIIAKDGRRVPVEVNTRIMYEDGIAVGTQGIARDITERKVANEELQRQQTELRVLFDLMPAMIWFKDTENNILRVNKRVAEAAGLPFEEIEGKPSADIYPKEAEKYYADDRAVIESGKPKLGYVETVPGPDGADLWVQTDKVPYFDEAGRPIGIVVMAQDVTERKNAEAILNDLTSRTERRERMLTTLLSSMSDFAQIYDHDGRIVFVNEPLLKLWDKTLDEVVGKDFHELGYPRDLAERLQAQLAHVFSIKEPITDETPFTGADATPGYYEYIFSPAIGPDGNVDFVVGSTRDVTGRKLAEQRIKSSEETLSRSQEIAHLGSWEIDIPETGNVNEGELRWSDEVFRIFGYQPQEFEVTSDSFFKAVHPDDRRSVADAMEAALRAVGKDYQIDHRILQPGGTERFVHEHAEIIRDAINGRPVRIVGTMQDITTQKHLSEQLRQSQKMEAIGTLAGGIAHDFNNLLTAINGYSDLTLKRMPPDDPMRNNIKEVREAGSRAAELTGQLLAFSRKQMLKTAVINLNTVVSNIENMLRRIIRESIELRTVLAPELGNINADQGQIEQVIMNLAINARDAMQDGGTLTVRTENIHLDEHFAGRHLAVAAGDFIRLTVTDTGEGMDAEIRSHIFDPFFTTKEVGKGTGLGLSTVYGIVKQSGGDIMVYSEPGHGTTFKIYLPCVDEIVEKPRWTGEDATKNSGTETILLAEDEEIVRTLVFEILSGNGYTVLPAASGEAALTICREYAEPIHMLLTDVIMPKMGGSELRDKVVKLLPDIKVMFMSGYTDDSIANRGVFDQNAVFIEKPFSPDVLSRKIRGVLDQ
jgi:two-component system cell cycle sensor histidine kinase/response regulator CckA